MKTYKAVGWTGLLNLVLIVLKFCGVIKIHWMILLPILLVIAAIPWILRILFVYWIYK